MKFMVFVALLGVLIGFGYLKFNELTRPLPLPEFDTNKYWGPGDGSKYKEDKSIKPFSVKVEPEVSVTNVNIYCQYTFLINNTAGKNQTKRMSSQTTEIYPHPDYTFLITAGVGVIIIN